MRILVLVVLVSAAAGSVLAQNYKPPFVLEGPSLRRSLEAGPPALSNGKSYWGASFACTVKPDGSSEDCELLNEIPEGVGVADAARRLIPEFKFAPALLNGVPTAERKSVLIGFTPKTFTPPKVLSRPTEEEMKALRPPSTSGRPPPVVELNCIALVDGRLDQCRTLERAGEDPAIVAAALQVAKSHKVQPATFNGQPVAWRVAFVVDWGETAIDAAPDWRKKPTPQELLAVWPEAAMRRGVGGSALIECKVSLEGALFECQTRTEKPAGAGFGLAAIALTPQLLMTPATKDGHPVVATVRLPITFAVQGGPSPPSPMGRKLVTPLWQSAPSYQDAIAAFPLQARNNSTPGHVALACDIKKDGSLGGCEVISEQPKGLGFGKAARDLATRFRTGPTLVDGTASAGASVHLAVTFPIEMLGGDPRVGRPRWVQLPSVEDMAATLPPAAGTKEGQVVLDCRIIAGGHVEDCKVADETPAGLGFGPAALKVADKFVLSLWTEEGLPTMGARVRVPIRYALD